MFGSSTSNFESTIKQRVSKDSPERSEWLTHQNRMRKRHKTERKASAKKTWSEAL